MIIIWVQKAIGFAALIMLAALGELLTEKSGGLNLGTPGTMCVGAATGFIAVFRYCQAVESPNVFMILLLTIGVSFLSGLLLGFVYGFFTVSLRINQNVVGLALTIFGCGLAEFLSIFFVQSSSGNVRCDPANRVYTALIPGLSDGLGPVSQLLFSYGFMLYVTIALTVGMTLFFAKTKTGLNLRAVGESPATADAAATSGETR
jgi:simple sugar transport system permease protein